MSLTNEFKFTIASKESNALSNSKALNNSNALNNTNTLHDTNDLDNDYKFTTDTEDSPPLIQNFDEFLQMDQKRFQSTPDSDSIALDKTLPEEAWPRVDTLQEQADGPKALEKLALHVSKIASTLRIASQKEFIHLVSDLEKSQEDLTQSMEIMVSQKSQPVETKKIDFMALYNSKNVESIQYPGLQETCDLPNQVIPQRMILMAFATWVNAYPDIIAHAMEQAFIHCFPKSIKYFDLNFKIKICDYFAEWFHGMKPSEPWCFNWEKRELNWISLQQEKYAPKETDIKLTHDEEIDSLTLSQRKEDVSFIEKQGDSCIVQRDFKLLKKRFDVRQNSPIVKNYLKCIGEKTRTASLHVHRTEKVAKPLNENIPTYRQILTESEKSSQNQFTQYKSKIEKIQKERWIIHKELVNELAKEKKVAQHILANPELIKEKADQVVQKMHERARQRHNAVLERK